MTQQQKSEGSPKRKMSEMILEMGEGFVGVGDTVEERQNRLNAACSACNMACVSPEIRQKQLDQYAKGYLQFNPATSSDALAKIIKDMETLIERKLQLFPDDRRQIVSAKVVKVGDGFRTEVASATLS